MPYLARKDDTATDNGQSLLPWITSLLGGGWADFLGDLHLEEATPEAILPWLAYELRRTGAMELLPEARREELQGVLRQVGMMHLDCEAELERLARSAAEHGIRLMAFKGHAVARTLYPHPACRTTSDFDLLIEPGQVAAAQKWLAGNGYTPLQHFVGTTWLGAQSWASSAEGNSRFHADLHWDYTNRMYFRRRLSFDAIWAQSIGVPCGDAELRVPCPVDNLVLACVHLAAFDPGLHVRLIWLLDIYLLMEALGAEDIQVLLQRAGEAHAVEACLVFGERAAELGDAAVLEPVLVALRERADEKKWGFYQRTLRNRGLDLSNYWWRLSVGDKVRFFGDMGRWLRVRDRG